MSGFAQLAQILADPEAYNMTYAQAFETVAEAIIVPSKPMYLGPHIMGLLIGALQYGIVVVLFCVWLYYFAKTDSLLVRLIVVWLFVFATVAIGHVAAWTLHLFVYNFGLYSPFIINDYSMWFYIIDMLIRTPVSGFFAHRAFRLAGRSKASYLLVAVIGACMGLSAAGSIGVKIIVPHDYLTATAHQDKLNQIFVYCYYAGAMAADVIITTTIAVSLMRTRTGWSETDRMINRILYLTVETQLPPTCLAIGFIIIYSHDNTSPLQAFFVASSQTYVITFLAVLVTRLKFTGRSDKSTNDNSFKNASLPQHATVQITTDVYEEKHAYDSRAFKKSVNRDELHPEHTLVNSDSESSQDYYPASNSSKVGLTPPPVDLLTAQCRGSVVRYATPRTRHLSAAPPTMATRPLFDVGVLRDTLLPNLGFHTALAVPVYLIGRGTDTFEAKDYLWPSGMVANAWWSALGRPVLLDGVPVDTVWKSISYPGKLILTGVTLWGGRLFYRILSRRLKRGTDDARYKPLHKDPKAWNSAIWKTFLPEAIVQAFITLPFTAPFKLTPVLKCPDDARGVLAAVAVGLFSAGFALEVLADFQLDNHKQRGDEGILTDGVWSIVRHPNYLGDTLLHASFPILLFAYDLLNPYTLLGPLANWFFLRHVGGDKENEASQEERYRAEDPVKLLEFTEYKMEKNSFWPSPNEVANKWLWAVIGAGAAGSVLEIFVRARF